MGSHFCVDRLMIFRVQEFVVAHSASAIELGIFLGEKELSSIATSFACCQHCLCTFVINAS